MNRPSSISVIICSRGHDISAEQRRNIESTIGVPHEIIAIDNSDSRYNIFSAYNEGVRQSQNDVLCFMHDDVRCKTENWGIEVLSAFEDSKVGLLGISGPSYLSTLPVPWWSICDPHFRFSTIYQFYIDTDRDGARESHLSKFPDIEFEGSTHEVAVCDGMLMCIPRSLFNMIAFDDSAFKGFHYYDLDICMQVRKNGYICAASFNILFEHISTQNNLSVSWANEAQVFYAKWRKELPIDIGKHSVVQKIMMEYVSSKRMNAILRSQGISPWTYYTAGQIARIILARIVNKLHILPESCRRGRENGA